MVLNIRQKQIGAAPPPQRECAFDHIVPIELVIWLCVVCFDVAHLREISVQSPVICNIQD